MTQRARRTLTGVTQVKAIAAVADSPRVEPGCQDLTSRGCVHQTRAQRSNRPRTRRTSSSLRGRGAGRKRLFAQLFSDP